ncbi:hypothetical protein Patl1_17504 [Pistacia atlantica]|uniref:Uncharacterized protein n=1 Tax=Pistacia atlantica TaxID=434234 RepID=A0ACC1C280_9ROSI|nr:hypothetical protein Patl1_17504 [Pistacia atlantica]
MTTIDTLISFRITVHKPCNYTKSIPRNFKPLRFARKSQSRTHFVNRSFRVLCESSQSGDTSKPAGEDFVSRVLKENPSQLEPKYLIGQRLYTLKEKENLSKKNDLGILRSLAEKLNLRVKPEKESGNKNESENVYLKDILREYKGKLYVPEQVFGAELSEEEEFNKNVEDLPKMIIEDFRKYMKCDKVRLLTSKEVGGVAYANGYRDFVVDLKEIPGDKSLQRTKWAMRLDENEVQALLEEYKGPQYEIERRMTSWVGKLPEYPHPVASSISSRMMVELGMVTAIIAAAAAVVGGFLASAVFAATSFIFATTVYVVWPIVKPFVNLFLGLISSILERVQENLFDLSSEGGIFTRLSDLYSYGGVSASLEMLKPIILVLFTMVLLVRFTLSRRPKNFRKWDLWQGIDFSRSKAEARVDGSTGVKFSDVAGIDEAVEELQELVRYLKNPELFDKMGIKPPHGVLLEGPPGCGKTLVAKAIAGEAGVPFYQMAGSEFVEVLVGVGSARIRDLFKRAKVNKPSVIFIDEIDALATRYGVLVVTCTEFLLFTWRQGIFKETTDHLYNAATQERETTLNQLLIELDGFDTGKGIRIRPPNAKGRTEILKIHASKVKMSDSVDLSSFAKNLPGWTGARLAQLVQEAALVAVRKGHDSILQSDMDDAVDRLTVGPKRIGLDLGHQGQCRRATTEMGLAMTSHLLRRYENAEVECCDRISIVPRGQTLSQLIFHRLDDESYMFERRPQLLHRLQVLLGGRAAEEVIYGQDTSRASVNYLADASWLARKILTIWNLENPMVVHGEPPPWRKNVKFVGPRLDFEGSLYDDYDLIEPPINFDMDDDVARRTEELLHEMYGRTVSMLRRHHAALLKAVKVLLNQKEVSGIEIDFILNNYPPQTPLSHLLEEESPGTLPFIKQEQGTTQYALPNHSKGQRLSKRNSSAAKEGTPCHSVCNEKFCESASVYPHFTNGSHNYSNGMLLEPNMSANCNNSIHNKEFATYKVSLPETSRLEEVFWKLLGYAALVCEAQKYEERNASKPRLSDGKSPHTTYLNFDEFRSITKQEKGWGMDSQLVNITHRFDPDGSEYNYASAKKGAKVVAHNKEAKGATNILGNNHDKYLRNPCSVTEKFVVIELAEETLVDDVKIANFEHYSSNFKEFELSGSLSYPTEVWSPLGKFVAANVKQLQSFKLPEPKWARYLKLSLLSHYGSEFYCTLSVVEVYGVDAIERMLEDLFVASEGSAPSKSPEPNSTEIPSLKPEVGSTDSKKNGKIQNGVKTADVQAENMEDRQKLDKNVPNPSSKTKIPDPGNEVRQQPIGRIPGDTILRILMQKVKSLEQNLSVLEEYIKELNRRQQDVLPELDKELVRISLVLEKSKVELQDIINWKETVEKELSDLEAWKADISSRLNALVTENSMLRLDVEKIINNQANLESTELAVLSVSLFFAGLATLKLVSARVSTFFGSSQSDKVCRTYRGWVLMLASSSMTIFVTLLSS